MTTGRQNDTDLGAFNFYLKIVRSIYCFNVKFARNISHWLLADSMEGTILFTFILGDIDEIP